MAFQSWLYFQPILSKPEISSTVKPVNSDHWREFWKRLHKTGNLERKNIVRVYNPHQLLTCSCGGRTNAWIQLKIWQEKCVMQWKTCSIIDKYFCLLWVTFRRQEEKWYQMINFFTFFQQPIRRMKFIDKCFQLQSLASSYK